MERLASLVQLERHCIASMNFSSCENKSGKEVYTEMLAKIHYQIELWKKDDAKDFEEKYGENCSDKDFKEKYREYHK